MKNEEQTRSMEGATSTDCMVYNCTWLAILGSIVYCAMVDSVSCLIAVGIL